MLFRFCLYGFLKNQQYFEPFLVLVFLEKGLSFFEIGLLIAVREITVNLLEVVSGAVADIYGRRRSMIGSFAAYIASFLIFGLASHVALLFLAMVLFGTGEAFRTGTHKAMIFTWLRLQGRIDERTRVYGQTRSWSKIGSSISVVLAAVFVLASNSYTIIFYLAVIPYLLGIINFLGYPKELEGGGKGAFSLRLVVRHLRSTLAASIKQSPLRRLIFESMGFEGMFKAAKDYLQPVLQGAALAIGAQWAQTADLGQQQQTALLVGPVYFVLYLLSAVASRQAHRLSDRPGGEDRAARVLWGVNLLVFSALLPAMMFELYPVIIGGFVFLFVLQNIWRPILISRFDAHSDETQGATVLSIESQAKSAATMIIAPVLGYGVDCVRSHQLGGDFWPVALLGVFIGGMFFRPAKAARQSESQSL